MAAGSYSHGMGARDLKNMVPLLTKYGMQADAATAAAGRQSEGACGARSTTARQRPRPRTRPSTLLLRTRSGMDLQRHALAGGAGSAGLLGRPIRKPHENALGRHWLGTQIRSQARSIMRPEHGQVVLYPTSKWLANRTSWQVGRRSPAGRGYRNGRLAPAVPLSRAAQAMSTPKVSSQLCTASHFRCRA